MLIIESITRIFLIQPIPVNNEKVSHDANDTPARAVKFSCKSISQNVEASKCFERWCKVQKYVESCNKEATYQIGEQDCKDCVDLEDLFSNQLRLG